MTFKSEIEALCKSCPRYFDLFQDIGTKTLIQETDEKKCLDKLKRLLLQRGHALDVAKHFRARLLDLLNRSAIAVGFPENDNFSSNNHRWLCVTLALLIPTYPVALKFALGYFSRHPSIFEEISESHQTPSTPKKKKQKVISHRDVPSDREIVESCFIFIRNAKEHFSVMWDWTPLLSYLSHEEDDVRWLTCLCVTSICNFSPSQTQLFLSSRFDQEQLCKFSISHDRVFTESTLLAELQQNSTASTDNPSKLSGAIDQHTSLNSFCRSVTSVAGVLLPCFKPAEKDDGCLVSVSSTNSHLRSLALSVKKGSPVLLQGPIGSGKTSLVEHLAKVTGRSKQPNLLKVQLGDQTDSKMLLGTYRCTDVPGEFIWQPGTLLQAVQNGYWILLEDIDCAPMDVISVLIPLIETNSLMVPGHSKAVKAVPDFQLFATQRLLGSSTGLFKANLNHSVALDKLFSRISIDPLSPEELKQVIRVKWPLLSAVADRIVEVYLLISAGLHELFTGEVENSTACLSVERLLPSDGRPISTRDLLKWCQRMSDGCSPTGEIDIISAFQDALDCFCYSIPKTVARIAVAEAIASRLNVSKATAEFYCTKYKPVIESSLKSIRVGRTVMLKSENDAIVVRRTRQTFAFTRQGSALLEQISVALNKHENVLLVGETGTGKTATVQYLAEEMGCKLIVINMNQNSDSADLLGGFKPVDLKFLVLPLKEEYEDVFNQTFSRAQNSNFISHVNTCYVQKRWKDLFALVLHTRKMADSNIRKSSHTQSLKSALFKKWNEIEEKVHRLQRQLKQCQSALAFSFIEGSLVRAIQDGNWVLLDEINLASQESLECLCGLLESNLSSLLLVERGDTTAVKRHPNFRLIACMNPATDVGKRDLPSGLRNRFTEFYVMDLEDVCDLRVMVQHYLKGLSLTATQVEGVVQFYLQIRKETVKNLTDGMGNRPHYSLRTLCRALKYAAGNPYRSIPRSLYEAFCLSFLTQLDRSSHPAVIALVIDYLLGKKNVKGVLGQKFKEPAGNTHIESEGYFVPKGDLELKVPVGYILTKSVRRNLKDIVRVVAAGKHPILIQGETSIGKTSLIKYLADMSGNRCVRVNNHEFTDLQEYVGSYAADRTGKLVFNEGVLVDAMRQGYWIILDELNLAPTDVLEALNRVLDDNRELFIPETQETIKAHPKFMLFATQNPPGMYGGRKVLSRAFRNRFIELHFDEIPQIELIEILEKRCALPETYCKKLVKIMNELQTRRSSSGIFAGKKGLITLRDLFRWAERYRLASEPTETFYDWEQHLADEGYILLAGRARRVEEVKTISEVIEKHLKCRLDTERLFSAQFEKASPVVKAILQEVVAQKSLPKEFDHLVWTYNMRRLAVLVGQALRFKEPVLLIGDTGCGKTTICQLFAALSGQPLYSVNCHMHSEGTDFLGGLRPVRNRERGENDQEDGERLFEWVNGPLVTSMMNGAVFLADEVSLADDSVLERLNSVLEPERTLLLAEKGSTLDSDNAEDNIVVVAEDSFRFVATMNPGGDYGKKELSPALRNRFTEIWCPSSGSRQDMVLIIEHNLALGLHFCNQEDGTSGVGNAILEFLEWFNENITGHRIPMSIRDILAWVYAINKCTTPECEAETSMNVGAAYIHGACLVYLDAIGAGNESYMHVKRAKAMKETSLQFLVGQVERMTGHILSAEEFGFSSAVSDVSVIVDETKFGLAPFFVKPGPYECQNLSGVFTMEAPTTRCNALRVLRAMQLTKPILLEGSPGVGKTSLIVSLAKAAGYRAVRINLSEQTDISDLFGADLPVEGGKGGQFAWRDGPLLRALKCGDWVVLDELNLASQSVLEGLNACLDHRAEIFVPELGKTFHTPPDKVRRIFACQNPLSQGGARKGLPKSFLNRFTQVYIEPLSTADLEFITMAMYPTIPTDILGRMVQFNQKMYEEIVVNASWGTTGGPWEINLRDVFRWCDLLIAHRNETGWNLGEFVGLIYADRMRTAGDKEKVIKLYKELLGDDINYESSHLISITSEWVQVGHSLLSRMPTSNTSNAETKAAHASHPLHLMPSQLGHIQSLMKCVEMNWMAILVGGRASGKSSLVALLAELCGAHLEVLSMNTDMDTTELLGGFQQADLNRNLELVSQDLGVILNSKVKELLLNEGNLEVIRTLMQSWFQYEIFSNKVFSGTTKDEAVQFLEKVQKLKSIVKTLKDITVNEELTVFETKLDTMANRVQNDESINCGGQFEWVDSMLVNALQKGFWLMIDNVNFCSPSVLDRLNCLLEPNGVLSISERGICGEEIPTYKPHPNFRLILSMNPKNGEISRAMRNRGVEIFIEDKEEIENVSPLELKTLLESFGLIDVSLQKLLTKVHVALRDAFTVGEKPSIGDLFQAAQLTVQRIGEGDKPVSALADSCRDIYLNSQHQLVKKQVAKTILDEHLTLGDETAVSAINPRLFHVTYPSPLLNIVEFSTLPEVAKAKQDCAMFDFIFEQLFQNFDNSLSSWLGLHPELSTLHSKSSFLGHFVAALNLLLQTSPSSSWKCRIAWLQHVISSRLKNICQSAASKSILNEFESRIENAINASETVFASEPAKSLEKKMVDLLQCSCYSQVKVPYDLRWNVKLLNRLTSTGKDMPDSISKIDLDTINALANRCNVMMDFMLWKSCVDGEVDIFVQGIKKRSTRKVCLLELSIASAQGVKSAHSVPKCLVTNLHNFLTRLLTAIEKILDHCHPFNDSFANQWKMALMWVERFWSTSVLPFSGKWLTPSEETVLNLHFSWLCKKAFPVIFGENWKFDTIRLYPNLRPVFEKLAKHFNEQHKFFNPMGSKVVRSYGHPNPFCSVRQAEAHSRLQKVWSILTNPRIDCNAEAPIENFSCASSHIFNIRKRIKSFLMIEGVSNEDLERISELEIEVEKLVNPKTQSDITRDAVAINEKLWPAVQHLELLEEQKCINGSARNSLNENQINLLMNFTDICFFTTPFHQVVLHRISRFPSLVGDHQSLEIEWKFHYLNLIWNASKCGLTDKLMHQSTPDEPLEIYDVKGPGRLYIPQQSILASSIITGRSGSSDTDDGIPASLESPLGQCSEKIAILQDLSTIIWNNVCFLNPSDNDVLIHDIWSGVVSLGRLFSSLSFKITSSSDATVCQSFYHIEKLTTLPSYDSLATIIEHVLVLCKFFGEAMTNSTSNISRLWDSLETITSSLLRVFKECGSYHQMGTDCFKLRFQDLTAGLWARIGWIQMNLLTPIYNADPAVKRRLKLGFCQQEMKAINEELSVIDWQMQITTGRSLADCSSTTLHPRILTRQERLIFLHEEIKRLQLDQATRPEPSQYEALRHDLIEYSLTIGSAESVLLLLKNLDEAKLLSLVGAQNLLRKVKVWIHSQFAFLQRIQQSYPWYKDLTLSFLNGIMQMVHGMALLLHFCEVDLQFRTLKVEESELHAELGTMLTFPSVSERFANCLDLSKSLLSSNLAGLIEKVCAGSAYLDKSAKGHQLAVLKSGIMEMRNHVTSSGFLKRDDMDIFENLLRTFVAAWQQQEDEKRKIEAEKESLFEYKTKVHGEVIDEEVETEKAIKTFFPSYREEFADLTVMLNLDDDMDVKQSFDTTETKTINLCGQINQQQVVDIVAFHKEIVINFTAHPFSYAKTDASIDLEPNYALPLLERFTVASDILSHFGGILDYRIDASLLNGLAVVGKIEQHILEARSEMDTYKKKSVYDFYRDSNIPAVVPCRLILEDFVRRIQELLREWPDHPALVLVLKLIVRILEFPVTCPVMKFVTGFEMLLEQAQDWEKNAHKGVSIIVQLQAVTNQIIQWRKLEISCWSTCLDTVEKKVRNSASKWWFHVYALVMSFLSPPDLASENATEKPPSIGDICGALEKFMETSPVGEYKPRLDILFVFSCHLMTTTGPARQRLLTSALWNHTQYYNQFLPAVYKKLEQLRQPVEKSVKGFVKIARWSDLNFFAIKESVDKSHRMLYKYSKQYELSLQQPANVVFADQELHVGPQSSIAVVDEDDWKNPKIIVKLVGIKLVKVNPVVDCPSSDLYLSKIPRLCSKMHKLCKTIATRTPYLPKVENLNKFIGEMIEHAHDLRSLEVNQSLTKEKQKSEAKNIHLRKRKALSDLFKILSDLGLSYRKGQIFFQEGDAKRREAMMLLPPLEILEAHKDLMNGGEQVISWWKDCPDYFYRSVARMALLQSAFQEPSKELGTAILQRCQGFVSHLLHLCTDQRQTISQFVFSFFKIRTWMQSVDESEKAVKIYKHLPLYPDQKNLRFWMTNLLESLAQIQQGLGQFLVLLRSCPGAKENSVLESVSLHGSDEAQDALWRMRQHDTTFSNSVSAIEACLGKVRRIRDAFYGECGKALFVDTSLLLSWKSFQTLSHAFDHLEAAVKSLPANLLGDNNALNGSLHFIKKKGESIIREYLTWKKISLKKHVHFVMDNESNPSTRNVTKIQRIVSKLTKEMLFATQEVYKSEESAFLAPTKSQDDSDEGETAGDESEFFSKLHGSLYSNMNKLGLKSVQKKLEKIIRLWNETMEMDLAPQEMDKCTQIMLLPLPLVRQYLTLCEFYLISAVKNHRVTTKLTLVLLGVFVELVKKGFCLPVEYSDEAAGEGSLTFENIEGGGIGEGEGKKDVSDRIENEDQLEEAQQQGQEQKEKPEQPNLKNEEHGIEMTDDFDGGLHNADEDDENKSEEDSDEDSEEELEKQMGDLKDEETDKLDEKIWGDDDDEEDDESDGDDKDEEDGPGDGKEEESRLVANEDNKNQDEREEGKPEKKETDGDDKEEEEQKSEINMKDEREYEEDKPDPYYDDKNEEQKQPQDLDLPEDLNLDGDEKAGDDDEDEEKEEEEEQGSGENEGEMAEIPEENSEIKEEEINDAGEEKDKQDEDETEDSPDQVTANDLSKKEEEEKNDENQTDDLAQEDEKGDDVKDEMETGQEPNEEEVPEERAAPTRDQSSKDESVQPSENVTKESSSDVVEKTEDGRKDTNQETVATNDDPSDEVDGIGEAEAATSSQGHQGEKSQSVVPAAVEDDKKKRPSRQHMGKTNEKRSLGSADQSHHKRLKTEDADTDESTQQPEAAEEDKKNMMADAFQHIKDSDEHYDQQVMDAATAEQMSEQVVPSNEKDETNDDVDEPMASMDDRSKSDEAKEKKAELMPGEKKLDNRKGPEADASEEMEIESADVVGERVDTLTVERGLESTIHTQVDLLSELSINRPDMEKLRAELKDQLQQWSNVTVDNSVATTERTVIDLHEAQEAWRKYEEVTQPLSQELCEQLRLILEPTLTSKLRGDYRTGKRLNMRKVIPFVASQFRKDKIWLRRTKPNKRDYQILLAIDDSSSMADNNLKQLAFEALALINKALMLLEVGDIAIAGFGETVRVVHQLGERFSDSVGARMFSEFTFQQKKTRVGLMLDKAVSTFLDSRKHQHSSARQLEIAQLLIIVSDGLGMFNEGSKTVKEAVRRAKDSGIFSFFIVLDNPANKDSIFDHLAIFDTSKPSEIKSYMDEFPFPFYIVLRDINSLPSILGEALRQWFELITSSER